MVIFGWFVCQSCIRRGACIVTLRDRPRDRYTYIYINTRTQIDARTAGGPEGARDVEELLLLADAPDEEEGVAEVLVAGAFPQLCFGCAWECVPMKIECQAKIHAHAYTFNTICDAPRCSRARWPPPGLRRPSPVWFLRLSVVGG